MDPFSIIMLGTQLGLPFLSRLGGGGDKVSPQIPGELQNLLAQAMLTQGRQQALVDPAAASLFGFNNVPDAVPLRPAVNQLAFALLPNFVRPSNSLFPGTAPPFEFLTGGIDYDPPFFNTGVRDPGGSGPGGELTPEDIARRERLQDEFAPDIESGKIRVGPTGRLELVGFNDRRGEGPITLDDIKRRLTPHFSPENGNDGRRAVPR